MARPTTRRRPVTALPTGRHGRRGRSGAAATGVLLLLVAGCVWWGAAVRAETFDDAAVLPAGVPARTLQVPVGSRVVLWSNAAEPVDGSGGRPRCTARDLTFDQQLQVGEPVQDYRHGVLAGAPGRVIDALVPPRWTPVAVLHTGGDRLRLVCDPAASGDLAVSPAPAEVTGVATLWHGWSPLAVCAAVMTLSGVGLLVWGPYARRRARAAGTGAGAGARAGTAGPGPASAGPASAGPASAGPASTGPAPVPPASEPASWPETGSGPVGKVRVPAARRSHAAPRQRKSIRSMSVSVPSERKRSSS